MLPRLAVLCPGRRASSSWKVERAADDSAIDSTDEKKKRSAWQATIFAWLKPLMPSRWLPGITWDYAWARLVTQSCKTNIRSTLGRTQGSGTGGGRRPASSQ